MRKAMSKSGKISNKGGISFLGALGLLFITLKLLDYIDWSWWFVLLPLYIQPLIFLSIVAGVALGALINEYLKYRRS